MKNTYYEDGFIFTEIEETVMAKLKQLEPQKHYISAETVEEIRNILKMEEYNDEELQGLRNSVVKDLDETYDDFIRVSMVTSVIDNEKIRRGMAA